MQDFFKGRYSNSIDVLKRNDKDARLELGKFDHTFAKRIKKKINS